MSDGAAARPFRLASMTRRQASTAASSPRSLAASRTIQAASAGLSEFGSPEVMAGRSRAMVPNDMAFIDDFLSGARSSISMRMMRRRASGGRVRGRGALARLIELQNAPRGLDIEAAIFALHVIQVLPGDAVILGAQKQQRHGGLPREVEGFRQNQQHVPVPVDQG